MRETFSWGWRHLKIVIGFILALGALGGLALYGSPDAVHDQIAGLGGIVVAGAVVVLAVFGFFLIQAPVQIAKDNLEASLRAEISRLKDSLDKVSPGSATAVLQVVRKEDPGEAWGADGDNQYQSIALTKLKPETMLIMEISMNVQTNMNMTMRVFRNKDTLVKKRFIAPAVGNEPTIFKFTDTPGAGPLLYTLRLESPGPVRQKKGDNDQDSRAV
jgi:hypothetical protein